MFFCYFSAGRFSGNLGLNQDTCLENLSPIIISHVLPRYFFVIGYNTFEK
jgi:hypothetical protein